MAVTKNTKTKKANIDSKTAEERAGNIIVIKIKDQKETIIEGKVVFSSIFNESTGDLKQILGQISTPHFINNTLIEKITTWRYIFSDVSLIKVSGSSDGIFMTYDFLAKSFDVVV